jgi:hypothetical protein
MTVHKLLGFGIAQEYYWYDETLRFRRAHHLRVG